MRILEFHPGVYRNLPAGSITFTVEPARPSEQGCSIRFLVGPNGVGKTNLLRFLAGIFLALDEDFRQPNAQNPAYSVPFRLVYQLHGDTITIESSGQGRSGVRFTINDAARDPGDLPARDQILPTALLVYTSGDPLEWNTLFTASLPSAEELDSDLDLNTLRPDDELAPDRFPFSENKVSTPNASDTPSPEEPRSDEPSQASRRIYLVEQRHLKLALLAALIDVQARQALGQPVNSAFLSTLAEIKVQLLGFAILIEPRIELASPTAQQIYVLSRLYDLATVPLQEWDHQRWVFDLAHVHLATDQSTLLSLHESPVNEPFQFFQTLVELYKSIQDVELVLNYTPPQQSAEATRTLLATHLSDGEFSFLARMALVYLLQEPECLFLLDEPEVHFNDDWKRNLVDNIEQALIDTQSEVILTSHASITLTDAFPEEVILLSLDGQQPVPLTLGAEPGEILRRLFHAERTVGKRATRRIEAVLQHGTEEELNKLLGEVGTGFYRFKIVEELQRRASSD